MSNSGLDVNYRWWLQKPDQIPGTLWSVLQRLERYDVVTRNEDMQLMSLYEGKQLRDLAFSGYLIEPATKDKIQINVIESCCDTALSKLTDERPAPRFCTSNANSEQQARARDLDSAIDSLLRSGDVDDIVDDAILDGCRVGSGFIKVIPGESEVTYERVLKKDLHVDPLDALYGRPRTLMQEAWVDREVLAEAYPKKREEIMAANGEYRSAVADVSALDQLLVIEAWRLPSRKGAKDGAHCLAIQGCLLLPLEKWTSSRFPFAHFRWKPRGVGFFGKGIAEILEGQQADITDTMIKLRDSENTLGKTFVIRERSAKVDEKQITSEVGDIIDWGPGGTPPTFVAPPVAPPELYQQIDRKIQRCYEMIGMSGQTASGTIPSGLEQSGRAQIVHHNIESKRFVKQEREVERLYIQLAECTVDALEIINESDPGALVLKHPRWDGVREIKYADVRLDRDDYVIKCWPVSALSKQIEGKMDEIQKAMQIGAITDPQEVRRILSMPEMRNRFDLYDQSAWLCERHLDAIMTKNEPQEPKPWMNLSKAKEMTQAALCKADVIELAEENRATLRAYYQDIVDLMTPPVAPAPAAPVPPVVASPMPLPGATPPAPGPVPPPAM